MEHFLPILPAQPAPAHRNPGRAGAHRDVRHVQHRRPAVAAMGEQETALGPGTLVRRSRGDTDPERHSGQHPKRRRLGRERGERGIGRVHGMTEPFQHLQTSPVAPGLGDRAAAGGENGPVHQQRRCAVSLVPPAAPLGSQSGDAAVGKKPGAASRRQRQQPVPHVAGAVGTGKELGRPGFLRQRDPQLSLEEGDLLPERPGAQHVAKGRRGGSGDEA